MIARTLAGLVLTLASLLSLSNPAHADTPLGQFKDWSLRSIQWQAPFTDACVATVEEPIKNTTDVWKLHFVFDRTGQTPPALVITSNIQALPKALTAQTDGSSAKYRFHDLDLLDAATNEASFWLAPQDFTKLYAGIRRDSSFKVTYTPATGAKQSFHFSLLGSMKAIDELEKQCVAAGVDVQAEDFFDELLKVKPSVSTPILPGGAAALWAGLNASWALYKDVTATEAALKALQAKIDPLVKEQQKLLELSGKLSADLQSKQAKQDQLKKRNLTLDGEIKLLKGQLAGLEQDLLQAQAVLAQKEAVFKPVQQAMQPYSDAVSAASWDVSSAQSELNAVNSEISQAQAEIQSLKSQLSQLNSQINVKNQELNTLRAQRIQAQSDVNNFNPSQELKKKTLNDWQLQSWQTELKQAKATLAQDEQALAFEQQELVKLQSALSLCQQNPGVDCSAIQQQLWQSQSKVSNLQSKVWDGQKRVDSLQLQIEQRLNHLEEQVEDMRQALVDRVTQLDLAINQVSFEIITVQNKINQIQGQELPSAEQRLSSAKLQLPGAQSRLQQAKQELAKAEKDLASFKAANGYEAKKAAYDQALDVVRAIQSQLNSLDSGIASREAEFKANAVSIAKLQLQIEQLVKDASANDAELLAIEALLTPLKSDKAAKSQHLATAVAQRAASDQAYKATLKDIDAGLGPLMPASPLGPVFGDAKFFDWL